MEVKRDTRRWKVQRGWYKKCARKTQDIYQRNFYKNEHGRPKINVKSKESRMTQGGRNGRHKKGQIIRETM